MPVKSLDLVVGSKPTAAQKKSIEYAITRCNLITNRIGVQAEIQCKHHQNMLDAAKGVHKDTKKHKYNDPELEQLIADFKKKAELEKRIKKCEVNISERRNIIKNYGWMGKFWFPQFTDAKKRFAKSDATVLPKDMDLNGGYSTVNHVAAHDIPKHEKLLQAFWAEFGVVYGEAEKALKSASKHKSEKKIHSILKKFIVRSKNFKKKA